MGTRALSPGVLVLAALAAGAGQVREAGGRPAGAPQGVASLSSAGAGGRAGVRDVLILRRDEPAGRHCPFGGTRITAGVDGDSDGGLSPSEIHESGYVCRFDRTTHLASRYGAKGDGVTDDTAALQSAIRATLAQGGRLMLDAGKTYRISRGLNFIGGSRFELDGRGATLEMAGGAPVSWGYFMLHFAQCSDFTVRDLRLDANRKRRTPREVDAHNVMVVGSRRFAFSRVRSDNAVTDGYYLAARDRARPGTFCADGLFLECSADHGYRQGMSIINATRIRIIGGRFTRTRGTPPQAGIDVESNRGSAMPGNSDIAIFGASFTGNAGRGISLGPEVERPERVTVGHSYFADNGGGGVASTGSSVMVLNNLFEDFDASDEGVVRLATRARGSTVAGNVFRRIHMKSPPRHGVVEVNYGVDNSVRANVFEDVDRVVIRVRGTGNVVEENVVDGRAQVRARCEARLYGSHPDCYY